LRLEAIQPGRGRILKGPIHKPQPSRRTSREVGGCLSQRECLRQGLRRDAGLPAGRTPGPIRSQDQGHHAADGILRSAWRSADQSLSAATRVGPERSYHCIVLSAPPTASHPERREGSAFFKGTKSRFLAALGMTGVVVWWR